MNFNDLVQTIAIYALPVLFAITLHEAAHGYVARHFGDLTAYAQGRVSLNPLRHIDPLGTIVVPLVMLVFSGFLFGWAKPVPVNYSALRKPRPHMAWVAAAGPVANLLMAVAWALLLKFAVLLPENSFSDPLELMAEAGIKVNVIFMCLNLLPILPLDGGRIVASLLPKRAAWQFSRLEPWGIPLLLLLMFVPVYGSNALSFILSPLLSESSALIRAMVL